MAVAYRRGWCSRSTPRCLSEPDYALVTLSRGALRGLSIQAGRERTVSAPWDMSNRPKN